MHIHIELKGGSLRLLGGRFRLIHGGLLGLTEGPQRVHLDFWLRVLGDIALGHSSLDDDVHQVLQVGLHINLPNPLHIAVPVLQVSVPGGVLTGGGPAEEDRLRHVGHGGDGGEGGLHNVLHPGECHALKVVGLAVGVDGDGVQKVPGHVDHPEAAEHNVFPFVRGQELLQVLHAVDGLNALLQHLHGIGNGSHRLPQFLPDPDILGEPPMPVLCEGGPLRDLAVAEHQAPALMHPEAPVDTGNVVELRLQEAVAEATRSGPRGQVGGGIELVDAGVVRDGDGPIIHSYLINATDVPQVQRLIQTAAVINHHHRDGPTVEAGPLQGGGDVFVPLQPCQGVLDVLPGLFIGYTQVDAVLHRLISGGVDDLRKQTPALV